MGRGGEASTLNESFSLLLPDQSDAVARPYWDGLKRGQLLYQVCRVCAHRRLPPTAQCPKCLSDEVEWAATRGRGRLASWVVFHRAYHPAFEDQIPYAVGIVELDEGPRMLARLKGRADLETFGVGDLLMLKIEDVGPIALPHFEPAPNSG